MSTGSTTRSPSHRTSTSPCCCGASSSPSRPWTTATSRPSRAKHRALVGRLGELLSAATTEGTAAGASTTPAKSDQTPSQRIWIPTSSRPETLPRPAGCLPCPDPRDIPGGRLPLHAEEACRATLTVVSSTRIEAHMAVRRRDRTTVETTITADISSHPRTTADAAEDIPEEDPQVAIRMDRGIRVDTAAIRRGEGMGC